jgi:hypothetical protein
VAAPGLRYLPLAVFLVVYILSCVVGALLVMGDDRTFIALYEYFSGTPAPHLTAGERADDLVLLFAAPAALVLGYATVTEIRRPRRDSAPRVRNEAPVPGFVPHVVFYALALLGAASLARAGAFSRVSTWLHYSSWIDARAANFAHISFFGFVNLYVLVPTAAAWVVVATRPRSFGGHVARWLPVLVALLLSLMLFMRKQALVLVLIIAFAWGLDLMRRRIPNPRRIRLLVAGAAAAFLLIYGAAVIVPVYSQASNAITAAEKLKPEKPAAGSSVHALTRNDLDRLSSSLPGKHRDAILAYAVVSPFTRSAVPALYYPVVFPKHHPFYGLDLGLDVLGIGQMPDDNIVLWNYLNPNLPGGAVTGPYQFVLYSQVGLVGAVVVSLFVGGFLALFWRVSQSSRVSRPWDVLLGALVLVLAAYLGIDSARNSLIVSYGVGWGFLFVGLAAGTTQLVFGQAQRRRLPDSLGTRG